MDFTENIINALKKQANIEMVNFASINAKLWVNNHSELKIEINNNKTPLKYVSIKELFDLGVATTLVAEKKVKGRLQSAIDKTGDEDMHVLLSINAENNTLESRIFYKKNNESFIKKYSI